MNCGKFTRVIALVLGSICLVEGYEKVYEDQVPRQADIEETIFVIEMIRHAARAYEKDDALAVFGVE